MRLYVLMIFFLISSLGFAQKYLGDLPEANRTCKIQNQIFELVTTAEYKGLIKQIKKTDGTVDHIELTKFATMLLEKAANDRTIYTIEEASGILAGGGVLGTLLALGEYNALKICTMITGGALAILCAGELLLRPEPLGSSSSFLEGIISNPVTILNQDPVIVCNLLDYNPETSASMRKGVNSLYSVLTHLIQLDTK